MSSIGKVILYVFGILVIVIGSYAAWYSYERQVKIVRANCIPGTPSPTVPPTEPQKICAFEAVPPTLWNLIHGRYIFEDVPSRFIVVIPTSLKDILLGNYSLQPVSIGCDQSATTTDCSKFSIHPEPSIYTIGTTTSEFSNFSFSYPGKFETGTGWDSGWCAGVHQVHSDYPDHKAVMATTSAPTCGISFNEKARTLSDFENGYSITDTFVERIHNQSYITINGIRMLRQIYSQGHLRPNGTLDVTMEASVDHQLRYIFFDGKSFVVITGWREDGFIDSLVKTINLKP